MNQNEKLAPKKVPPKIGEHKSKIYFFVFNSATQQTSKKRNYPMFFLFCIK